MFTVVQTNNKSYLLSSTRNYLKTTPISFNKEEWYKMQMNVYSKKTKPPKVNAVNPRYNMVNMVTNGYWIRNSKHGSIFTSLVHE